MFWLGSNGYQCLCICDGRAAAGAVRLGVHDKGVPQDSECVRSPEQVQGWRRQCTVMTKSLNCHEFKYQLCCVWFSVASAEWVNNLSSFLHLWKWDLMFNFASWFLFCPPSCISFVFTFSFLPITCPWHNCLFCCPFPQLNRHWLIPLVHSSVPALTTCSVIRIRWWIC